MRGWVHVSVLGMFTWIGVSMNRREFLAAAFAGLASSVLAAPKCLPGAGWTAHFPGDGRLTSSPSVGTPRVAHTVAALWDPFSGLQGSDRAIAKLRARSRLYAADIETIRAILKRTP